MEQFDAPTWHMRQETKTILLIYRNILMPWNAQFSVDMEAKNKASRS